MAGHPIAVWPIQAGQLVPAKGLAQTKGTTGIWIGHAYGLICWTRLPLVHIGNLAKPCHSFALNLQQTQLHNPDSIPLPEDFCYSDVQLQVGLVGHPVKWLGQAHPIQLWLHTLLLVAIL